MAEGLAAGGKRGKFLGIRMIFWVLLPMLIGPGIGSALIRRFGVPTLVNGQAGFIPVPVIFQVGACLGLLALIPLAFGRINRTHKQDEEQNA